jgi:hypothetical protein
MRCYDLREHLSWLPMLGVNIQQRRIRFKQNNCLPEKQGKLSDVENFVLQFLVAIV